MYDSPASVLRVRNGNCLQLIRQYGTRGCEVIVSTILYHAYLSADFRIQGRCQRRATDSTYNDSTRPFRRQFVVPFLGYDVA